RTIRRSVLGPTQASSSARNSAVLRPCETRPTAQRLPFRNWPFAPRPVLRSGGGDPFATVGDGAELPTPLALGAGGIAAARSFRMSSTSEGFARIVRPPRGSSAHGVQPLGAQCPLIPPQDFW